MLLVKSFLSILVVSTAVQLSSCSSKQEPADEPVTDTPETTDAAPPPVDQTPVAPPAATPAKPEPAAPAIPAVTRRVMYVKDAKATLREAPDQKSKSVGSLVRGDHILVSIEGEWARTDSGAYIHMKSLSEKGIGRRRGIGRWKGGEKPSTTTTLPASTTTTAPATTTTAPAVAPVQAPVNK